MLCVAHSAFEYFKLDRTDRDEQIVTKAKAHHVFKEPWHAVRIVGRPGACAIGEKVRAKRFLSDEAPRLPLAECPSRWRCKCIYRHFPDRRAKSRRETDRGGLSWPGFGEEKRQGLGRRVTDQA